MVETLRAWEHALAKRLAELGATPSSTAAAPLDVLEAHDPTEAARYALRLVLVEEMRSLRPTDYELAERARLAHGTIRRGLAGLSLDEVTSALVSGALWVSWTVPWEHARFTFLSEHPALVAPEAKLHVLRAAVAAHGFTAALVPWFLHRLIEDPVPGAGDELYAAWRAHREDARVESLLAEAVIASGHREGIEAIAATLATDTPSREAVSATLCLEPTTATERLGHLLDPARFEPGARRVESLRLLEALTSNGLRAGEIAGFPSRRPRGWVRADARWVPLLLALRTNRDPNVSRPARGALAHADPEVVEAALPKPSKKKAGKGLALRSVGRAPFVRGTYWGDPIAGANGRIALFPTESRIEVRRVADGFPVELAFDFPAGLGLSTEARGPIDDGWDREGIHGIALHPRSDTIALSMSSRGERGSGVVLLDGGGSVMAEWKPEDTLAHRLHWGAEGKTLWVMAEEDSAVVIALDPETLAERGRRSIGSFPPPAFPSALSHPKDDVGCFQVACGQDGIWLKCVEHGAKGTKVRAQKLSAVHHEWLVHGFAEDGMAVLTTNATKLLVRDWPTMAPRKGKVLAGTPHGAAGSARWVIVPVATVGTVADRFEVFRLPDGEKVGMGPFPEGHRLLDVLGDLVVTVTASDIHVWALDGLGGS